MYKKIYVKKIQNFLKLKNSYLFVNRLKVIKIIVKYLYLLIFVI